MASWIKSVSFDCVDALKLASFWAAVLGTDVDEDATSERAYVEAAGWGGPNMWFNRVPEGPVAKNRMHLDLRAPDTMAAEMQRLVDLGATIHERNDHRAIMTDPEGNVFCLEQGPGG